MTVPVDAARAAVQAAMPHVIRTLEDAVRIPSCAFAGFDPQPVLAMADATVQLYRDSGVDDVRLLDTPDSFPTVYGTIPAPPGAPTVLLYSHYDVQPAPAEQGAWHTDPWTPTIRDGRLFGRGAADDKSGLVIHAHALRIVRELLAGPLPFGVTVVVEGGEECGGQLPEYVTDHPELFAADLMVIADGGNEVVGKPVLEISTRGIVHLRLDVSTLAAPVHSGLFGGVAPDAMTALVQMLATLHDADGNVAVPGLYSGTWPADGAGANDARADLVRAAAGVLDGVSLVGESDVASRLWAQPAISVLGIDAPSIAGAVSALVPVASALVSMRVPPGADADEQARILRDHLLSVAPWGVHASVTDSEAGQPWSAPTDGPFFAAAGRAMAEAFGAEPTPIGSGGAIPLLLSLQQAHPRAEFVVWGAEDGAAHIHSSNESVDLAELERALLASVLLLLSAADVAH